MRELDVLLSQWLDTQFDLADNSQKGAFAALLELPDPELAAYLLRGEPASDAASRDLIRQIRGDAQA